MTVLNIIPIVALAIAAVFVVIAAKNLKIADKNLKIAERSADKSEAYARVSSAFLAATRAWRDLNKATLRGASVEEQTELRLRAGRLHDEAKALSDETRQRFPETTDARSTT